ncbi:hypothetical protein J4212_04545 [Candidatus Woesearchaeota archaeon]|nr:hypothetical protein [Candidatus Woesearchaeota archaeon]
MSEHNGGHGSNSKLSKYGFTEETAEETRKNTSIPTGYPKPSRRYRLHYEAYNISIEEPYFWILHYLRYFQGYHHIEKITDVFAAAENSSFFGANQQRLGLQQEKVSQYLATIGKMVRELFQLVRELRVIDERLSYYADSYSNSRSQESAEITLKGIWVDMVEQGAKNPASVYGMAREVQFTTLPDLFFSTHPRKSEDVDEVVDRERSAFNRKVKEVLKRKLRSFMAWKEHTYEEMKNRRIFTLKYLRQHYEIIRMYMAWVRPYLKNIQRLNLDQKKADTPDIITAFENSMIEVELLAKKSEGKASSVVVMHYLYRIRPEMNYSQEYNRGPLHLGRVEIDFRSYGWTDGEIENYRRMRAEEDMELLGVVDASVKAAMESLGDELMRYLQEAGEDMPIHKKEDAAKKLASPHASVFKGFREMFTSFSGHKAVRAHKKPKRDDLYRLAKGKRAAATSASAAIWNIYHHFKKHHGMLNW